MTFTSIDRELLVTATGGCGQSPMMTGGPQQDGGPSAGGGCQQMLAQILQLLQGLTPQLGQPQGGAGAGGPQGADPGQGADLGAASQMPQGGAIAGGCGQAQAGA